jgi:hypothetical protein
MKMSIQNPSLSYRILLTIVGLFTCTSAFLADWNETHIHNPRWPPHAKFHNGQTMSMGLALGMLTLYYLWRPLMVESAKDNLNIVVTFASLYWVTQLSAILFPGTMFTDPEFGDAHPQIYICAVLFALIGVGYSSEKSRIAAEKMATA